jgi:biopolymer transport protein ExbD
MPLKTHFDEEPTLNLTAMLDVMFLLIIFFMLGTRFIDDERKIGLKVPEVADRGALSTAPSRKEVSVFRDGTITLDGKAVSLDQLTVRLAAARRQYSDLGVLVRGDARGEFQNVAAVLTACKQAGIKDLGITVRPMAGREGATNGRGFMDGENAIARRGYTSGQ